MENNNQKTEISEGTNGVRDKSNEKGNKKEVVRFEITDGIVNAFATEDEFVKYYNGWIRV